MSTKSDEIDYIIQNISLKDVVQVYTPLKKEDSNRYRGLCPLHNETTPSFVVYDSTQSFYCYGCGEGGNVFNFFLKKTNLNFKQVKELLLNKLNNPFITKIAKKQDHDKAPEKSKPINLEKYKFNIPELDLSCIYCISKDVFVRVKAEEIYEYVNDNGKPAGYVVFFVNKEGKKEVRPIRLHEWNNELVWALGGLPSPRPLYNLQEILDNKGKKPILVVEGERCANAAKALLKEFVVTTWIGGCKAIKYTDWSYIEDSEVFIWPDYDEGGLEAGEIIANQLPRPEIISIINKKMKGWDIADAIKEGRTEQELTKFILSFRIEPEPISTPIFDFDLPPNLLGDLTKFILEASLFEHPLLATGTALAIMSILQAQKVVAEGDIHPNLYIITLATSGIGKSFSLTQIERIMAQIGCDDLLIGKPASGAGLVSALHYRKGRALMKVDEFGEYFGTIAGSSASDYQHNLIEYLLELFSASSTVFRGIEYSNRDGKNAAVVINKPNLTIYGTTVPTNFYEALTSNNSLNGFFGRFLVLQGVDINIKDKNVNDCAKLLPESLKKQLEFWAFTPQNVIVNPEGISWRDEKYDYLPYEIPFEHKARVLIREYRQKCKAIAVEAELNDDNHKATIYNRGAELATKVSLLAREHGNVIDKQAVEWAIKFVDKSIEQFYRISKEFIAKTEVERDLKEIERYLRKVGKWVDKKQLLNRFRIKTKHMQELLDTLTDGGTINYRIYKQMNNVTNVTKQIPQWRIAKVNKETI